VSSRLLCKKKCGTWSVTLRVEHSLRVLEKAMLRVTLGPARDEVAGDSGKPHSEELYDLSHQILFR
jgi:hypothetical protein